MKINKVLFWFFFVLVLCISVHAAICTKSFWDFTISSALTLLVALIISYYLTQRQEDSRNKKEILVGLVNKIQLIIQNPAMTVISMPDEKDSILMRNRSLNNYICILEEHKEEFRIAEDVQFIRDRYDEYRRIIDNHINDVSYLSKSAKELSRPIELMNSKLYELMLKIYE